MNVISNIRIMHLTNEHNLEPFCCGNDDLDDFLKNCAITEQEDMLSRTYLTCLYGNVVAKIHEK